MNGWTALRLLPLSWREWQHHPWRHGVALLAVALGVALAWSVHLINQSALGEFSAAVRSANGLPDWVLRGPHSGFDESVFERAAADPAVQWASAVLEVDTVAFGDLVSAAPQVAAKRDAALAPHGATLARATWPLRVLGLDALRVAPLAADLLPLPAPGLAPLAALDPQHVFLNAAARANLSLASAEPDAVAGPPLNITVQAGASQARLRVAGSVAAAGSALAVMDIAGAQALFGQLGRVSRVDLRLAPGADAAALWARLNLPPEVTAVAAAQSEQGLSNLSRAYRVNLTVLALVALFVGAFLVFSVVSLSVAQRTPALALLGVLGLTGGERRALVLLECGLMGLLGSALGLLLGTGLAVAALRWLAGDLGGGYFPGVASAAAPPLLWSTLSAAVFLSLGCGSALVGGWWPARAAQGLAPAQALKGLGPANQAARGARSTTATAHHQVTAGPEPVGERVRDAVRSAVRSATPGLLLLAAGAGLSFVPPMAGLPVAAYAAVAAILLGGVALVPAVVQGLLALLPTPQRTLPLLALRRANFQRATAVAATAGVVASLALGVALTVMVNSFRGSVTQWLDEVLPADLYARTRGGAAAGEQVWLPASLAQAAATLPGVQQVQEARVRNLLWSPGEPAVVLLARPLHNGNVPALVGAAITPTAQATSPGPKLETAGRDAAHSSSAKDSPIAIAIADTSTPVYVSEAMAARFNLKMGHTLTLPLDMPSGGPWPVQVHGIYRDFARPLGTVLVDLQAYRQRSGDTRINELALWLTPGASEQTVQAVQRGIHTLLPEPTLLEFAASKPLRELSLRIFDRSFAVTTYLQAVAIVIGLVGVAASLSAQVLARRKEFGLLAHLGFTQGQVLTLVAAETAAWMTAGAAVGVALGLAVSLVLVWVVNPQSFHWTMQWAVPVGRVAALALAVWCAGVGTAAFTARRALSRSAVLSVKEDW